MSENQAMGVKYYTLPNTISSITGELLAINAYFSILNEKDMSHLKKCEMPENYLQVWW